MVQIEDAAKSAFQRLCTYTVVLLSLLMLLFTTLHRYIFILNFRFHSPQENIVDLLSDEGSQPQELSVNPMQDSLQEVPLSWVLAVKQLQELKKRDREKL